MQVIITPAAGAAGITVKITGSVETWLERLRIPTRSRRKKEKKNPEMPIRMTDSSKKRIIVPQEWDRTQEVFASIASDLHHQQDGALQEQPELFLAGEQLCALYKNPPAEWDALMIAARKVYRTADLLIDEAAQIVYRDGQILNMGLTEFHLLCHLVKHNTICCSRNSLMVIAEGRYNRSLIENTLTKHINRLRRRLGKRSGGYIYTNNGQGYRWIPKVEKMYITR